jgi:hypothetical protein
LTANTTDLGNGDKMARRKPFDGDPWLETPAYLVSIAHLRGWLQSRLQEADPRCVECNGEGKYPCTWCDGTGSTTCTCSECGDEHQVDCEHCDINGDVDCSCTVKRDPHFRVEICGRLLGYEETDRLYRELGETRNGVGYLAGAGKVLLFEEKPLPRQRRLVKLAEPGLDSDPWDRKAPAYAVEQAVLEFPPERSGTGQH